MSRMKNLPQFFPWGNSVRIMGFHTTGSAVRNHISLEMGKKIDCNFSKYVPFVVPGLSASSSSTTPSPTSSSSSSQDSVFDVNRYSENPAPERSGSASEELRGDPLHESTETENKKINEEREVQRDISHELPDWPQEFRENLFDESTSTEPWGNPEQGSQDTSKSSHEFPMEPRAKVEPGSGKHSVYLHFARDPHCDICLKTKITRASCRRRAGTVVPRAEHFGDMVTADDKVLSEESESRNNHRYAMVVQDLATQWIQSYPCKTKSSQVTQKNLMKCLEPTRKPKVIYTDNSLAFGKSCEELSWNHCTSTSHRSRTNGTAETAVRRVKKGHLRYCCNQVWMKNGVRIPWNVTAVCETFKISCLMGRHPMKGGSEYHLNGPDVPFGAMVECHLISTKDLSRQHQFVPKVLPDFFVGYVLYAGESGKETLWSRTLKNWRRWTHLNSTPEGSMQRKC